MVRSSHNFAHATTVQLSWHVQMCDLSLESKLDQQDLNNIMGSWALCYNGAMDINHISTQE